MRENTAYSKDFIQAILIRVHQAHYVLYINIFKNMFKIHREIGPPVGHRVYRVTRQTKEDPGDEVGIECFISR